MLSLSKQLLLLGRDMHIVDADRDACPRGIMESQVLDLIEERDGLTMSALAIHRIDQLRHFLLGHKLVCVGERHIGRKHFRQNDSPNRGLNERAFNPHLDPCMHFQSFRVECNAHFFRRTEQFTLALTTATLFRQPITTEHHVLRRHRNRLTVRRREDVIDRHHQHACLDLRFDRQRNVDRHLVSIEVGVECGADQRMQPDRLAFDQNRIECLNTETVQRRRTVQQHGMLSDDLIQYVPDFRPFFFD